MEGEHRELVERDLFGRIVQPRIVVVLLFYVGGSDTLDRYIRTILVGQGCEYFVSVNKI